MVSVILTTYNRPDFLEQAIESVLNQNYEDIELLVIDDDSDSPKQQEILMKYWNRPKVWILKSSVKRGKRKDVTRYAHMINYGLKICRGDYIAYLCDDDYFMPGRIFTMVNFLKSNKKAQVVYGKQKIIRPQLQVYTVSQETDEEKLIAEQLDDTDKRMADKILENPEFQVDHSSVMHTREVFEKAGYWDDDKKYWGYGDAVYWMKIVKAGYKFYPINYVTDAHIYHDGSFTKGENWRNL